MKKIYKCIAFLVVAGLTMVSCDYDETNYDSLINEVDQTATYYVQFANAAELFETSFTPDGEPANVETTVAVKLLGTPRSEDLAVDLNFDPSSDLTSEMFEMGATSLVIPAGKTSASTTLTIFSDMLPVDETSSFILNIDAGENTATAGDVLRYNVFRTPPCIPIPGEYKVVMTDSYGDGWQTTSAGGGPGITVEVDGVQIAEAVLSAGAEGEATVTIAEGSQFAKWTFPGDFYGEIGYEIYDPNGVLVASAKIGEGGPDEDGTAGTIDVQACVEEGDSV